MTGITVTLTDATCYHVPPERVLNLGLVGDVLFLEIAKYSEDAKSTYHETIETFCVGITELARAVSLLVGASKAGEQRKDLFGPLDTCDENDE